VVVRSEYRPGDRTGGALDAPLSELCVPGRDIDCEPAIALAGTPVTKHDVDAWTEPAFRAAVRGLPAGTSELLVCGLTATSCVKAVATSLATRWALPGTGRSVLVTPLLTAARRAAYRRRAGEPSAFHRALADMRAAGVELALDPWWSVLRPNRIGQDDHRVPQH
jgi:nicotinamidase-related amidase